MLKIQNKGLPRLSEMDFFPHVSKTSEFWTIMKPMLRLQSIIAEVFITLLVATNRQDSPLCNFTHPVLNLKISLIIEG